MHTQEFDVVVVGGGPAGICAAVTAARLGARCALLERFGMLGGMLTSGFVQPILGSVAKGSMYDEMVDLILQHHPEIKIPVTRNGREVPVDVEEVKGILPQFVYDAGVKVYLLTGVVDTILEEERIVGVVAAPPEGLTQFYANVVIDATGDGAVAAQAGALFDIGRESDGKCQPATIEFLLTNVDEQRAITCFGGSDPVQMPNGQRYSDLCKEANSKGELPENVTIVRLHRTCYPGERNVNASQANGYDTLSAAGVIGAEILLRKQMKEIVGFLKKYVPGYENCMIKASSSTIGVRETRRIKGLESVEDIDVETGTRCDDVVVHKAWFLIDIHNPSGGGQAEKQSQPARPYDIPYGALVAKSVKGLMMAGRCISGSHRAHASYRVMAICMATGQAAGTAAALCAKEKKLPHQLRYMQVQKALIAQGSKLFNEEA